MKERKKQMLPIDNNMLKDIVKNQFTQCRPINNQQTIEVHIMKNLQCIKKLFMYLNLENLVAN